MWTSILALNEKHFLVEHPPEYVIKVCCEHCKPSKTWTFDFEAKARELLSQLPDELPFGWTDQEVWKAFAGAMDYTKEYEHEGHFRGSDCFRFRVGVKADLRAKLEAALLKYLQDKRQLVREHEKANRPKKFRDQYGQLLP